MRDTMILQKRELVVPDVSKVRPTKIDLSKIFSYSPVGTHRGDYTNGGFYMIQCKFTGMCYIGKSVNLMFRLKQHVYPSSKVLCIDKYIRKNGIENFNYYCLATYVDLSIDYYNRKLEGIMEYKFIAKFKTYNPYGFNIKYCYKQHLKQNNTI